MIKGIERVAPMLNFELRGGANLLSLKGPDGRPAVLTRGRELPGHDGECGTERPGLRSFDAPHASLSAHRSERNAVAMAWARARERSASSSPSASTPAQASRACPSRSTLGWVSPRRSP